LHLIIGEAVCVSGKRASLGIRRRKIRVLCRRLECAGGWSIQRNFHTARWICPRIGAEGAPSGGLQPLRRFSCAEIPPLAVATLLFALCHAVLRDVVHPQFKTVICARAAILAGSPRASPGERLDMLPFLLESPGNRFVRTTDLCA